MKQQSFFDIEYSSRTRKTSRDEFLETMERVIPWQEIILLIEEFYPKGERGRPPKILEIMLRLFLLQKWYGLSDQGIEDAIYDSSAMRIFVGVGLDDDEIPSGITIARFRRLLQKHNLETKVEKIIKKELVNQRLILRRGNYKDAILIKVSGREI